MTSVLTLWGTVRHLRPEQVAHRLRSLASRRTIPEAGSGRWRLRPRRPVPPARRNATGYDGESFFFLNRRHPFDGEERWSPSAADRLWIYNLHYFQYLWGLPQDSAWQLVQDWLRMNPPMRGPGWEPYAIALRLREWIEWLQSAEGLDLEGRATLIASMATQANSLEAQVEHHLDGNHLLEDAISLCWAGLSLEGPGSDGWLREGSRLLSSCLREQVLPDGGHDERSPMYQSILAEALLRLAEVAAITPGAEAAAVRRLALTSGRAMVRTLVRLSHPDGEIALLNDAGFGIAPLVAELQRRFSSEAMETGWGAFDLVSTGYAGYRSSEGDYLVFDRGPLGPDHQPGHGHADTLSFELSTRGERLFTDTGVFTYTPGPVRSADRSTAAHNTLSVDGRDQAELWESFRCGERPVITDSWGGEIPNGVCLGAEYEGPFGRLGSLRHRREIRYVAGKSLDGRDEVTCDGRHEGVIRFHLAPGLAARKAGGAIEVHKGASLMASVRGPSLEWAVEKSPYHPEFGRELERDCVVARIRFTDRMTASWQLEVGAATR